MGKNYKYLRPALCNTFSSFLTLPQRRRCCHGRRGTTLYYTFTTIEQSTIKYTTNGQSDPWLCCRRSFVRPSPTWPCSLLYMMINKRNYRGIGRYGRIIKRPIFPTPQSKYIVFVSSRDTFGAIVPIRAARRPLLLSTSLHCPGRR
jgi:hypothetical protein